jgi:hypothetical protein
MDRTALVELVIGIDIEGGKRLLKALDESGINVPGAFWLYFPEAEEWRLVFVMPKVKKEGSLKAYRLIDNELRKLDSISDMLSLHVTVRDPSDDLIKAMRKAIKTEPDAIEDIFWDKRPVNGVYIDGAYIYRMS